ncbi:O-methylsterigmatocystin oxidoreductase [Leucoagaricus sp. SymC.cos]|nr:O-methylsterigmatocystin oxidoreductase [Leucoagaricus sp. SymC.cos]
MQKKYRDMVYLNILRQGFLIPERWERTYDLFKKRSSNYSDYIHSPLILDIMEWGYNMGLVPYGIWWHCCHQAFHDFFYPNIVNIYQSMQLNTAQKFIQHLLLLLRHELGHLLQAIEPCKGSDKTSPFIVQTLIDKLLDPNAPKRAKEEIIAIYTCTVSFITVYHMATDDNEYDGYFNPKRTLVVENAWSILHDPEVYKDPNHFNLDHYLKDGQLNSAVQNPLPAFGFGRRICPGHFFSDNVMFATIAHTLVVFDIKPVLDEAGKEIKIEADTTGRLVK